MNYTFYINDFEGPLDLLLHLVKQSKMNIYDINLFDLIKEYLDFINKMQDLNIDVASEYLSMASELVHLKSKMLINKKDEEESDDEFNIKSEEDLRNKLLEYENIKNITGEFKNLELKRNEIYTRLPENLKEYYEPSEVPKGLYDADILYKAFLEVEKKLKLLKPLDTTITKKEISVLERTKEIGILRSLGASKKDIKNIFKAETIIIGTISGFIGVGVTILLNKVIDKAIYNLMGISHITYLSWNYIFYLILISIVLCLISGLVPAKIASKKDPVISLRSE